MNTNEIRERFEKWISSEPFGRSILRNSLDETVSAWPGQYSDMNTEVAWLAFLPPRQHALPLLPRLIASGAMRRI